MVLKREQFNLEEIITKNSIRLLRLLVLRPYSVFGLTEMSRLLNASKSNILRAIYVLQKNKFILALNSDRKKVYRINFENDVCTNLWWLFQNERKNNLGAKAKNSVDLLYETIKDKVDVFIVFGSVTYGLETEKSDIDVLVVGEEGIRKIRFDYLEHKFEIHEKSLKDLESLEDFVILESLVSGIVYKGTKIFHLLGHLHSFPKKYLIYRLNKAREYVRKAKTLTGEAQKYYLRIAEISLGEIESLMLKGKLTPKKLLKQKLTIDELENLISKEGQRIWLTGI